MRYFISGHRNITMDEFYTHYTDKIDEALRDPNAEFVVGECDGVDQMAQQYLIDKTLEVKVYHRGETPENNDGGWITCGHYNDHIHRDSIMTANSDVDITWIRNWGDNSGTEQNVLRRAKLNC